jgi:hypothetical protein
MCGPVTEAATETLAKFSLTDNNLTVEFLVFWGGESDGHRC